MAALRHKCLEFNDLFKLYVVILRKKSINVVVMQHSIFSPFCLTHGISFKILLFT